MKEQVFNACRSALSEKILLLESAINDITESMAQENKSSVGDKHETGRARLQAESSKLETQLMEVKNMLYDLEKLNIVSQDDHVFTGSLVETNHGFFFISVAIGKVMAGDITVYAVSPASPLGQLLTGLQNHSEFNLNGKHYRILSID